jgi:hypothetical protein
MRLPPCFLVSKNIVPYRVTSTLVGASEAPVRLRPQRYLNWLSEIVVSETQKSDARYLISDVESPLGTCHLFSTPRYDAKSLY